MGLEDLPQPVAEMFGPLVAGAQIDQAQQKATGAQSRAHDQDQRLSDRGVDPDYVQTIEHFEGMTHEAMYQAVHGGQGMDVSGLRTLTTAWREMYADVVNAFAFNMMGMHRIFGDGLWKGASADAAEGASMRFGTAGNQLGQVLGSVASRMEALSWTAEAVRTAVVPPPSTVVVSSDDPTMNTLPGLLSGEAARQAEEARENARLEVVRALNNIYKPSYPTQGAGVPAYVPVPQVGDGGTGAGTGGNGGSGTGSGGTGAQGTGPGTEGDGTPAQQQSPVTGDGTQADGTGTDATKPSGLDLPATTPASANSGSGGSNGIPSGTGTGSGAGGSGAGGSGAGGGGAGFGSAGRPGGSGTSVPGTSKPGGQNTGTSAGTSGAGSRGSSNPRTMGPMGPMAPGAGARKQSEGDEEHSAPDYLRGVQPDWTEGISTPSGVIGGEQAPALDFSGSTEGTRTPEPVDYSGTAGQYSGTTRSDAGSFAGTPAADSRYIAPGPPERAAPDLRPSTVPADNSRFPAPQPQAPQSTPGFQAPESNTWFQAPESVFTQHSAEHRAGPTEPAPTEVEAPPAEPVSGTGPAVADLWAQYDWHQDAPAESGPAADDGSADTGQTAGTTAT